MKKIAVVVIMVAVALYAMPALAADAPVAAKGQGKSFFQICFVVLNLLCYHYGKNTQFLIVN